MSLADRTHIQVRGGWSFTCAECGWKYFMGGSLRLEPREPGLTLGAASWARGGRGVLTVVSFLVEWPLCLHSSLIPLNCTTLLSIPQCPCFASYMLGCWPETTQLLCQPFLLFLLGLQHLFPHWDPGVLYKVSLTIGQFRFWKWLCSFSSLLSFQDGDHQG